MEKEFEILEHTSDIGVIAHGSDIREVYINAAKGMFSLITESREIREEEKREIEIEAADPESLLVAWLNELIYLFDAENLLLKRFDITRLTDTTLKATVYGEKADLSRHSIKIGIKAATYHMLSIEKGDGIKARVLFDV
jgi:SHS2 domain-containing protein